MDLDSKFVTAVDVIKNLPSDGAFQPSNEMKLKFYAYYKQATAGPCRSGRPGFWDVVARAKHDAWAGLGDMGQAEAKAKYVDNLKQIVEAMNFSPDVENFMEALGPFYEEVEEDDADNKHISKPSSNIQTIEEESTPPDNHLGVYDISDTSLSDETSDSEFLNENSENLKNFYSESRRGLRVSQLTDVKDNNNCPNKLFEELQKTRQSLQEARSAMESREKMSSQSEPEQSPANENIERGSGCKLSQRDIDRMLGNIDGFIPSVGNNDDNDDEVSLSDDEIFEDSVESISSDDNKENEHIDVEATILMSQDMTPSRSPPAAPTHVPQIRISSSSPVGGLLGEEDEILVVTTEEAVEDISQEKDTMTVAARDTETSDDIAETINLQLALAVDRLGQDMVHLQARLQSVETIVQLQGVAGNSGQGRRCEWWPVRGLEPSTAMFLVTWPLLSYTLLHLATAAFKTHSRR